MSRADRVVVLAAALTALAVSVLTGLYPAVCSSCLVASVLVRSVSFSWLGMAFYTGLIVLLLHPRWARAAPFMLAFAAGTHGVLLYLLHRNEHFCPLCAAAGAAVGAAFLTMLWRRPGQRGLMLAWIVIGMLTSQGMMIAGEMYDQKLRDQAVLTATEDALAHLAPEPGQAALVVYLRPGCHFCEVFEAEDLPRVRAEFGPALKVELREPPPDLPTPAIIVLPGPAAVFLGRPSFDELRQALLKAQREDTANANSAR